MKPYGLTGGIGCGKSTAAQIMGDAGWHVIDTDAIAARLMQPGQPNHKNIVDAFGCDILNPDSSINRPALAELVFNDPSLRQKLNDATHPAIRQAWQAESSALLKSNPKAKIVVIIPLLFETGAENEFSATICVGCSPSLQRDRLRQRGWSDDHIDRRLQSQWPLDKKIAASTYVVWNNGTLESLKKQLECFLV